MYDIELLWPTRHRGVRPESIEVRKSSIRPILVIQQASPTRMPETETTEFWSTMIVHGPFIDEMHTKNSCNRFRSRARGSGARARWFMHARMTKFWWICTGTTAHRYPARCIQAVLPYVPRAWAARGRAHAAVCTLCTHTVHTVPTVHTPAGVGVTDRGQSIRRACAGWSASWACLEKALFYYWKKLLGNKLL